MSCKCTQYLSYVQTRVPPRVRPITWRGGALPGGRGALSGGRGITWGGQKDKRRGVPSPHNRWQRALWSHFDGEGLGREIRPSPNVAGTFPIHPGDSPIHPEGLSCLYSRPGSSVRHATFLSGVHGWFHNSMILNYLQNSCWKPLRFSPPVSMTSFAIY